MLALVRKEGMVGLVANFHFSTSLAGTPLPLPVCVILICHSILFWPKKKAKSSRFSTQLGLGPQASVVLEARRGMLWG